MRIIPTRSSPTLSNKVSSPVVFISVSPAPAIPVPFADWPAWAKFIKRWGQEKDIGVGDTVQRYAAKIGGERFKKIAKAIKMPCGCTARQLLWNQLYPYRML